jgi:lysophospholipid acyltransferase (LPLAT)-like uncharacterized protein
MRTGLRYDAAQFAGGALLDVVLRTVRWDVTNADSWRRYTLHGQPVIFALWHGRLLPLGYLHRQQGVLGLASKSADGEYIARLLMHWGLGVIRGSSSSGGDAAFREMIRALRAGKSIAITPDGPRGPRQKLKPGLLQLAQITGAPIILCAAAATRAWWFVSWDRFLVPQPFARVAVEYAEPFVIPRNATADDLTRLNDHIEQTLNAVLERVEQRVQQ